MGKEKENCVKLVCKVWDKSRKTVGNQWERFGRRLEKLCEKSKKKLEKQVGGKVW